MAPCCSDSEAGAASEDEEITKPIAGRAQFRREEDPPRPLWYRVMACLFSERCKCLHSFVLLAFFTCMLYPLYMYCIPCLFVEIIICACLCPYYNALNIPMWASIIVLLFGGYTMNLGDFQVAWFAHRTQG